MGNLINSFLSSFVFLVVASYSMFSMRDIKTMDKEHFKLPSEQKEGL
ncbi:hypothetical protein P9Y32_18500 [Bacillus cereus]|nr:hypothetical protein [Bacillus cereus]